MSLPWNAPFEDPLSDTRPTLLPRLLFEQLEQVVLSGGLTNLIAQTLTRLIAEKLGHVELAEWVSSHQYAYIQGCLNGFFCQEDPDQKITVTGRARTLAGIETEPTYNADHEGYCLVEDYKAGKLADRPVAELVPAVPRLETAERREPSEVEKGFLF